VGKGFERLEDKITKIDTKLSNKIGKLGGKQLTQASGQNSLECGRQRTEKEERVQAEVPSER